MKTYLVLLRGVNVGGKNKVPMASLRKRLENMGFPAVSTFAASGNVILDARESAVKVKARVEAAPAEGAKRAGEPVKVTRLKKRSGKKD